MYLWGRAFFFISVLISLVPISYGHNHGYLGFGAACDPSPSNSDPMKKCDSEKRLSCHSEDNICQCHHQERDSFNKELGQCEIKVGKFCGKEEIFPTICTRGASCNPKTLFCECENSVQINDHIICQENENTNTSHHAQTNFYINGLCLSALVMSVFLCN